MCQFIFCQIWTMTFLYTFLFSDAFLIAFSFSWRQKTHAFIISLRMPIFFNIWIIMVLILLSNEFITELSFLISFNCISSLLHTCQHTILFLIALLIQAHCFLDTIASLFLDSFFISLEYNLKQYFRNCRS